VRGAVRQEGGGRLVLVATPIGNLGDLSPRAVSALAEADVIVCEDTRRTGRLLEHAGVAKRRLLVANEHAEASAAAEVGRLLATGATVAVVTDAGTPGISDPGARLVRMAIDGDHPVTVVPGPAAAVAAVVISGLPADRFVMEGFLPRRGHERSERLAALAAERRTTLLYEAPHRLARTLADLVAALGPARPVAVCRELTKLHEEVWRGSLGEAASRAAAGEPRGEHVLVLGGAAAPSPPDDDAVRDALAARRAAGDDRKTAIATVTRELALPRRRVYELAHPSAGTPGPPGTNQPAPARSPGVDGPSPVG
jgi:16S rRNA (cytidine1402-2'-O)-methyltransferase